MQLTPYDPTNHAARIGDIYGPHRVIPLLGEKSLRERYFEKLNNDRVLELLHDLVSKNALSQENASQITDHYHNAPDWVQSLFLSGALDSPQVTETYMTRVAELRQYIATFFGTEGLTLEEMSALQRELPSAELSEVVEATNSLINHKLDYSTLVAEVDKVLPVWVKAKYELRKNDYEMSEGLADQLMHTQIRGVKQAEIRLPFDVIRILLPPNVFPGYSHIFLYQYSLIYVGEKNNCISVEPMLYVNIHKKTKYNNGSSQSSAMIRLQVTKDLCSDGHFDDPDGIMDQGLNNLTSFVFNTILYMTSLDVRKKRIVTNEEYIRLDHRLIKAKGTNRENILKQRKSLDPGYRIVLGTGIPCISTDTQNRDPLIVRTLVSGFLRNQPFGPAKKEGEWIPAELRTHRRIWIQPFWRGPDLAPETQPIRVMRNPRQPVVTTEAAGNTAI